jgi:hypothetical protein
MTTSNSTSNSNSNTSGSQAKGARKIQKDAEPGSDADKVDASEVPAHQRTSEITISEASVESVERCSKKRSAEVSGFRNKLQAMMARVMPTGRLARMHVDMAKPGDRQSTEEGTKSTASHTDDAPRRTRKMTRQTVSLLSAAAY